jgi:putative component of toxin-antitoxin plasmid stabilization module
LKVVLLLCAGDKSSQERDIRLARKLEKGGRYVAMVEEGTELHEV